MGDNASSSDTLLGGAGDDTLSGGEGADSLDGGADADTFIIEDDFGADTIVGGELGLGDDVIDLSALTGPVTVEYSESKAGTITDGADTLSFSQIEYVILTDFSDTFDGLSSWSTLDVAAGDGNDMIIGGTGDDSLLGEGGDDSITTGTGSDTVFGGAGNDTIEFFVALDSIDGGDGDDRIVNIGNTSSAQPTTISGGSGTDTFVLDGDQGSFGSSHVVNLGAGEVQFGGNARDQLSVY